MTLIDTHPAEINARSASGYREEPQVGDPGDRGEEEPICTNGPA
jgi:hypothetical protein